MKKDAKVVFTAKWWIDNRAMTLNGKQLETALKEYEKAIRVFDDQQKAFLNGGNPSSNLDALLVSARKALAKVDEARRKTIAACNTTIHAETKYVLSNQFYKALEQREDYLNVAGNKARDKRTEQKLTFITKRLTNLKTQLADAASSTRSMAHWPVDYKAISDDFAAILTQNRHYPAKLSDAINRDIVQTGAQIACAEQMLALENDCAALRTSVASYRKTVYQPWKSYRNNRPDYDRQKFTFEETARYNELLASVRTKQSELSDVADRLITRIKHLRTNQHLPAGAKNHLESQIYQCEHSTDVSIETRNTAITNLGKVKPPRVATRQPTATASPSARSSSQQTPAERQRQEAALDLERMTRLREANKKALKATGSGTVPFMQVAGYVCIGERHSADDLRYMRENLEARGTIERETTLLSGPGKLIVTGLGRDNEQKAAFRKALNGITNKTIEFYPRV